MAFSIRQLFDLAGDQGNSRAIDHAIRAGVRIRGTNLWILIFAILVASVGLNVNSTAVIIGAMLISPLMGPLIGIGYGAGINDALLIRNSARTLLVFFGISLVTSTLYFLISPLSAAHSELLSRTTPTLWDVLVAFFGGCAGIVAVTRRDASTVIPGVAIATALMPPICTAGFGLATRNWEYFGGATFLFTLNAFFIAFATLIFVKLTRLPQYAEPNPITKRNTRIAIAVGILVMLIPSTYLGYRLTRNELFSSLANGFIKEQKTRDSPILLSDAVDAQHRRVSLTFWGDPLPRDFLKRSESKFAEKGFPETRIAVVHLGSGRIDVAALRKELIKNAPQGKRPQTDGRDAKIEELSLELAKMEAVKSRREQTLKEILAQYPAITRLSISEGEAARQDNGTEPVLVIATDAGSNLKKSDYDRLKAWLGVKFPGYDLRITRDVQDTLKKKAPKARKRHPRIKRRKTQKRAPRSSRTSRLRRRH